LLFHRRPVFKFIWGDNYSDARGVATWERLLNLSEEHYLGCFANGLISLVAGDVDLAKRLIHQGISLNKDNVPLNMDMQGVLSRMGVIPIALEQDATEHVLISGYKNSH
jgi:hypothetical protein